MGERASKDYRPIKQWYKKNGKWIQTNAYSTNARENADPRPKQKLFSEKITHTSSNTYTDTTLSKFLKAGIIILSCILIISILGNL